MIGDLIAERVSQCRPIGITEIEIQDWLADHLAAYGFRFQREAWIGPGERIDFLLPGPADADGDIGLEVKLQTPMHTLLRQLSRYAQSPNLCALIVASNRARTIGGLPTSLHGKPLLAVRFRGALA